VSAPTPYQGHGGLTTREEQGTADRNRRGKGSSPRGASGVPGSAVGTPGNGERRGNGQKAVVMKIDPSERGVLGRPAIRMAPCLAEQGRREGRGTRAGRLPGDRGA